MDLWRSTIIQELSTQRLRWIVVFVLYAVAIVYVVELLRELPTGHDLRTYRDFYAYYRPALSLRHGLNPYIAEPTLGDTPDWFLLFEPLTFFSPFIAYWVWFVLNVLLLAASLWILIRDAGLKAADAWIIGALMLMYPPVAMNFWFAQSEILLLFVLTLFIHELGRGRQIVAALLLAAACLLRAYPIGLLGYLVARRQWRVASFALLGCIAGFSVTAAYLGSDVVLTFLRNAGLMRGFVIWGASRPLNQAVELLQHPANLNLARFVAFVVAHALGTSESSTIGQVTGLLVEVALVAIVAVQTARFAANEDRDWRALSLWIITVSMLSPIMWGQFMVCFIIVFVWLAGAAARNQVSRRAIWAAVASYALTVAFSRFQGYPFNWVQPVEERLVGAHPHLIHLAFETTTASLALLLLSAYWFTCDRESPKLVADSCRLTSLARPPQRHLLPFSDSPCYAPFGASRNAPKASPRRTEAHNATDRGRGRIRNHPLFSRLSLTGHLCH